MTKQFSKWASKQNIPENKLVTAISEVQDGIFEANLGGYLYKKGFASKVRAKAAVRVPLFVTRKTTDPSFIHGFAKTRKTIYQ